MAKILVVDDEKIISGALQRILARAGHEVSTANHGAEAIRLLLENSAFEFLFLDLLMPEIGGAVVLDMARKHCPTARVFMMTAYGDQGVRDDLIARGATQVLAKPFDDITKIPDLIS